MAIAAGCSVSPPTTWPAAAIPLPFELEAEDEDVDRLVGAVERGDRSNGGVSSRWLATSVDTTVDASTATGSGARPISWASAAYGQESRSGSPWTHRYDDSTLSIGVTYERWDLDEVELDFDAAPSVDLERLERDRLSLRVRSGSRRFGLFVEGGLEHWDDAHVNGPLTDVDGAGWSAGGGVDGFLPFSRDPDAGEVRPGADYEFALTYHDVDFDDVALFTGDASVQYLELQGRLGFGIDWRELHAGVGALTSFIRGDLDGALGDAEVEAENVAAYVGLAFAGDDIPLAVRIEGFGGEIRGFTANVEIRF
ncbi:MAG TPA: hypothetical protein VKE69_09125 [Planctomycetota bacterium]|nr:hypothetical protein [Planctomycetota bacterium]